MGNEITVKLKCTIEEIDNILTNKGFKIVEKFILDDTYYVPKNLELKDMKHREILSKAILLREVTELMPLKKEIKLTLKNKKIDESGIILEQSKVDCEILSAKYGREFLEALGYNKLMNILEFDTVYAKENFQFAVKDIKDGEKLIEVETVENNKELDTIEKIKQKINALNIPIDIDTNDYFIKKAEIELKKIL